MTEEAAPEGAGQAEPAYLELVGEEVDVLHCYDPDRGGDGMVVFRGVLVEVTDRGLTIDGDDRDSIPDDQALTYAYRSLIPWGAFLRVEAVDSRPV